MQAKSKSLYQLIWTTRRLFQQLREASDGLLENVDINSSQRAILEFLIRDGEQTVSAMARDKNVSRQHVQKVVNVLLDKGLVEASDNPQHKRSPLIDVTAKGKKLFDGIARKESDFIDSIVNQFNEDEVRISIETLNKMGVLLRGKSSANH